MSLNRPASAQPNSGRPANQTPPPRAEFLAVPCRTPAAPTGAQQHCGSSAGTGRIVRAPRVCAAEHRGTPARNDRVAYTRRTRGWQCIKWWFCCAARPKRRAGASRPAHTQACGRSWRPDCAELYSAESYKTDRFIFSFRAKESQGSNKSHPHVLQARATTRQARARLMRESCGAAGARTSCHRALLFAAMLCATFMPAEEAVVIDWNDRIGRSVRVPSAKGHGGCPFCAEG